MTWVYGVIGLTTTIAGLRWLLRRGDQVHADLHEGHGAHRRGGADVPDTAYVPDAGNAGRPGH